MYILYLIYRYINRIWLLWIDFANWVWNYTDGFRYNAPALLYPFCANKEKVIFILRFHGMLHKSRGGPCFHYNSLLGPVTWVKRWNQRVILRWRVSEFRKAHLILNNAGQKGLPLKCLRAFYSLVFPLFPTVPRAAGRSYTFSHFLKMFFFFFVYAIHHTSGTKRYVAPRRFRSADSQKKNQHKIKNK